MLKARVPQPPRCGAKNEGNKRQRGVFLFPHFILDKQNKVGRQKAKSNTELINSIFCTSNALEHLLHRVFEHHLLKLQQTEEIE